MAHGIYAAQQVVQNTAKVANVSSPCVTRTACEFLQQTVL